MLDRLLSNCQSYFKNSQTYYLVNLFNLNYQHSANHKNYGQSESPVLDFENCEKMKLKK